MSKHSEDQLKDIPTRTTEISPQKIMETSSVPNSPSGPLPVKYERQIIWRNVMLLTILHIAGVYGVLATCMHLKLITWLWSFACGGASGFGVTAGAHRLWTHRAYKAKWPLRVVLIAFYSMAGHNPLFDWVRDHRVHHKFSETDADPHNATRGFFFAHVGWLMVRKHPDVITKGRQIDMSDILQDPIVTFHRKNFVAMQIVFCYVVPILTPYLLWGETRFNCFMACGIARYVAGLNFTWLVNSAAHIWGIKPYDRRIMPAENRLVSLLAMGEGWHNYHHVFPWDYKAAELGDYSLNITTFWIDFFAWLGWAYDRKTPASDFVHKFARRHGDGTHTHMLTHQVPSPTIEEENTALNNNTWKSK